MDRVTTRRRRVREPAPSLEYALLAVTLAAVAAGFADPDREALALARAAGLVFVPAALAVRSLRSPSYSARRGLRAPLWVAALGTVAAVVVQASGGVAGPAAPLPFLVVGAGSLQSGFRGVAPWGLGLLLALLVPMWFGVVAPADPGTQVVFAVGLLLAATIPGQALRTERKAHERTRSRLRNLEDEARGLSPDTSALPALRGRTYQPADLDRDLRATARELQSDMDRACALLVSATGVRAATVYRPADELQPEQLVVVSHAGDEDGLIREVGAREGVFGAAFKAGTPVCLAPIRPDDPRVVHRERPGAFGAVLAVPLAEGDRRWGVLILDASDAADLHSNTRTLAGHVADFVARLVTRAVELSAVREAMRESHAFYEACREVSHHVRIEDIASALVRSAGTFTRLEAAAMALCDAAGERMTVMASAGFDPEPPPEGFHVTPSEGLLAQAVRHRTVIDRGDIAAAHRAPVLFGRAAGPVEGFGTMLVLPIRAPGSEEPLGAFVVARRSAPDFSSDDRDRLELLLHQVGGAVANGRLFAEHESRGHTDGMTGLPNHRRFQEVLGSKLAAAARTKLPVSLLLMDIDRFKLVNDTYGHPMGDEVIKRLAKCLRDSIRDGTDLAARYGGEEFCVVMEDTRHDGAVVMADRIREAFEREVFVMRDGDRPVSFRCTVSVGIATFPADCDGATELIDRADQALYASKEGGRNRTTCWGEHGPSSRRSVPGVDARA